MAHHANDAHGHDAHDSHGHAVATDEGATGPGGWPFALLIGIATLAGSLWAFMAH